MSRIICVGVGGSGMSALAQLFHCCGYQVIGIDSHDSIITDFLSNQGIDIVIGHGQIQLQSDDFVIYSDATIASPEVTQAKKRAESDLKHFRYPLSYFEFIGEISKYMCTIAIAGTHGKSTTTSMMISVLHDHSQFGLGIVGAQMKQFDGANFFIAPDKKDYLSQILGHIVSAKLSLSDYSFLKKYYFIIEADEFNRHFLHLNIDHLLITNIQRDHPDTYPHPQDYDQAFAQCIDHTRFTVTMLASQSDLAIAQKYADRIHFCPHRVYRFENIFGQHNHDNASLVEGFVSIILYQKNLNDSIVYRDNLTTDERKDWKSIRLKMLQQNPEAFGDLSYEIESAYEDQYWISKMNEPGRYRVLAYDGPKVIGSINAKVWDDDSTSGGLFGFYVDQMYRGSGVAYHLVDQAISFLCTQNIRQIKISVFRDNTRAISFYLKYGFRIVKEVIENKHGQDCQMYLMIYIPISLKLQSYVGISRRCEYLGINQHGIKIYSDYAHHPTEVQTTYQALCDNFPNHQIYIIYQAHQVGRIFNLRDEMVQVCAGIDELVLYHIYTAREDVSSLIAQQDRDIFVDVKNADDLASLLAGYTHARYVPQIGDIWSYIQGIKSPGVICIMTAGDLDGHIRKLLYSQ